MTHALMCIYIFGDAKQTATITDYDQTSDRVEQVAHKLLLFDKMVKRSWNELRKWNIVKTSTRILLHFSVKRSFVTTIEFANTGRCIPFSLLLLSFTSSCFTVVWQHQILQHIFELLLRIFHFYSRLFILCNKIDSCLPLLLLLVAAAIAAAPRR